MKLYREGNKVIIEAEESDCNAMANTPEMVADAVLSGVAVVFDHMNKHTDEIIPLDAEDKIQEAITDYKERWEITPAPVDPPAVGQAGNGRGSKYNTECLWLSPNIQSRRML